MASSQLYPGERIINDSSPDHFHAVPEGFGTGLDYSTRSAAGYAGVADPFPDSLLIPQSEWQARIQEMEAQKSRLSDIINAAGLPPKNQQQTSYCWVNAPTHCLEIVRVVQGEPMVILSPASAGAQITGFRNVGGWGKDALDWIVSNGVCPIDAWPANAISSQYSTAANKQLALNYRVDKWWVTDGSLEQIMSVLLRRQPGAAGLSWWSHEVTYCDPVWLDGAPAVRFRNSWGGDWPSAGASGYSILQGRKMMPDDFVVPVTAIAD